MIRWYLENDNLYESINWERYYGDKKYEDILRCEVAKIITTKAPQLIGGYGRTPYRYSGYSDIGSWDSCRIYYDGLQDKIGDYYEED